MLVSVVVITEKGFDIEDNHVLERRIILGWLEPRKNKKMYFRCGAIICIDLSTYSL